MQGMMIQEMSAVADQPRPAQGRNPKEAPEQSFGRVLDKVEPRAKKTAAKPEAAQAKGSEKVESGTQTLGEAQAQTQAPAEVTSPSVCDEVPAAPEATEAAGNEMLPFFMTALQGENAPFVEPTTRSERVAAAERIQQLIARWLQGQQHNSAEVAEETAHQGPAIEVPPGLKMALQQLTQVGEETDEKEEIPELSAEELQELQQLMAAMQQGQTAATAVVEPAQPLNDQPEEVEVETERISWVSPLSQDTAPKAPAQAEAEEAPAPDPEQPLQMAEEKTASPVPAVLEQVKEQPAPRGGLQEEQMARIVAPHREPQAQPLEHAQVQSREHGQRLNPEADPAVATAPAETALHSTANTRLEGEPAIPLEGKSVETAKTEQTVPAHDKAQVLMAGHGQQPQTPQVDLQPAAASQRIMQLPSGQQLSEGQLVDQVVTYLAGSRDGESGKMRLNLHPAELGSLRLDLMVEGDRVRAHLHAQSQQVQEVLDRHLPMLRDALQQHGLKIDEFRVDVQHNQEQGREQAWAWERQQQSRQGQSPETPWQNEDWQQEHEIPLSQLLQPAAGGISLRV